MLWVDYCQIWLLLLSFQCHFVILNVQGHINRSLNLISFFYICVQVDVSVPIAYIMAPKEEGELKIMQKASQVTCDVFNKWLKEQIMSIVDAEKVRVVWWYLITNLDSVQVLVFWHINEWRCFHLGVCQVHQIFVQLCKNWVYRLTLWSLASGGKTKFVCAKITEI